MTESEGVRSVVDVLTRNGVDYEDWEDGEDYEDCEDYEAQFLPLPGRPTALPAGVPRVGAHTSQTIARRYLFR